MTETLFEFHGADAEDAGVDGRPTREAEASLDPSARCRVVGCQPRRPRGSAFGVAASVVAARGVLDAAARTVGAALLRRRIVAVAQTRAETSAARGAAVAPHPPIRPVTINFRNCFNRTRRIGRTVNLIAVGTDAKTSAEGRFGIPAGSPPRFNGQSARLGASGPGRPVGPLAVSGAVGHFVTVARTIGAAVARCGGVAGSLTAVTSIALGPVAFVGAVAPLAPIAPPAID